MKTKYFFSGYTLILGILATFGLSSCLNNDQEENVVDDDPAIQAYIQANNLNAEKLPSGIYVVELTAGNGEIPEATEVVDMAVDLQLLDGTSFVNIDSYVFQPELGSFIAGLAVASISLEEGGSYQLIIPSYLAYGSNSGTISNVFIGNNSILQAFVNMNEVRSLNEQFQHERNIIEDYIDEQQLDTLGTISYLDTGVYKVLIAEGDTAAGKPTENSFVNLAYEGSLLDGVVFDQSDNASFTLTSQSLINGFYNGVKSMNKGEEALFIMTSNVAYGSRGTDGISPFSPLIFEVTLTDF